MKENPLRARQAWRLYVAGVGRLTGNAVRKQRRNGSPSLQLKILDHIASPKASRLAPLPLETKKQVAEILGRTSYWHGTGRYQYRDGQIIDLLDQIAQQRELRPSADPFDRLGHMYSVSLARSRMYARAYADLHRSGPTHSERHGSSLFWATFFLGDYALEAAREEGSLRQVVRRLQENGKDDWHSKVNQQPLSVFGTFAAGSDIPGNYPILFGVRKVTGLPTSHAIAIHEIRAGEPISLDTQITHLEVPRVNMAETEKVLLRHRLAIPVYMLEDFERYAATVPVSELMSPA